MTHPLLTALAQARRRDAPMFVKWCELGGVPACPATPASVARFVTECAALGMDRLWPAVKDISRMHVSLGLADPTLGAAAASAMSAIAAIPPPRSWPARSSNGSTSYRTTSRFTSPRMKLNANAHCGARRTRLRPPARS